MNGFARRLLGQHSASDRSQSAGAGLRLTVGSDTGYRLGHVMGV